MYIYIYARGGHRAPHRAHRILPLNDQVALAAPGRPGCPWAPYPPLAVLAALIALVAPAAQVALAATGRPGRRWLHWSPRSPLALFPWPLWLLGLPLIARATWPR